MPEILYLIVGVAVGAIIAFFVCKSKYAPAQALFEAEKQARDNDKASFADQLGRQKQEAADQLERQRQEAVERLERAKNDADKRIAEIKQDFDKQQQSLRDELQRQMTAQKNEAAQMLEKNKNELQSEHRSRVESLTQEYEKRIGELKSDFSQEKTAYENRVKELEAKHAANIEAIKKDYEQRIADMKADHDKDSEDYEKRIADIEAKHQARMDSELAKLRTSYDEQLKLFKEQLLTATERLLKERSSELQKTNSESIDQLFKPISENIKRMEQTITDSREAGTRNVASIEKTIQMMMESNRTLTEQADRLSTALTRKNKVAGNWGEMILSELLESQGLTEGVHFEVQKSLKDEDGHSVYNEDTGSKMIPDVILHLADNRDVVIDSKMSLTAFIDYQNADNEADRQDALARHIASVSSHIKELAGKNYNQYIKKTRNTIDFVIMFVPIDGALSLALNEKPELWREAFDKKVFIAGSQTLIAALRIIELTWVNVIQERNTAKVMDEARKLIDRVGEFYREFQAVGKKLDETTSAFRAVERRVNDSPQSILAAGRHMEALGARGKKSLPKSTADAGDDSNDE